MTMGTAIRMATGTGIHTEFAGNFGSGISLVTFGYLQPLRG